jgi:predicted GNAT superfamily acetyltransferase
MTQHPHKPRLTLSEPLGMAEPPRPEIAEAIARNEAQALDAALARINPDRLPRLLGEALARRFGNAEARRIADRAVVFAWEA